MSGGLNSFLINLVTFKQSHRMWFFCVCRSSLASRASTWLSASFIPSSSATCASPVSSDFEKELISSRFKVMDPPHPPCLRWLFIIVLRASTARVRLLTRRGSAPVAPQFTSYKEILVVSSTNAIVCLGCAKRDFYHSLRASRAIAKSILVDPEERIP